MYVRLWMEMILVLALLQVWVSKVSLLGLLFY